MTEARYEGHIWQDTIYIKCPEQANLQRQKVDQCLARAGGGEIGR